MKFKTFSDNSITIKEAEKLKNFLFKVNIHYDIVFDEFKMELFYENLDDSVYLRTLSGHIKIFKSMKTVTKILNKICLSDNIRLILF
jgi:hypothetical protein